MLCWFLVLFNAMCVLKAEEDTLFPGRSFRSRSLCDSPVCKERAQLILASVNRSADPCDDFYAYVCNRWNKAHPIPDDMVSMSPFVEVTIKVEQDLREILESLPVVPEAKTAREKAAVAYHSCMNTSISEEEGIKAVRRVLEKNGLGKWPVLDHKEIEDIGDLKGIVEKTGLTSLFTVHIVKDMDNPKGYILQLGQKSTTNIESRKRCKTEGETTWAAKFREVAETAAKLLRPSANEEQLKIYGRATALFASQLNEVQQPPEERRKLRENYCVTTVQEVDDRIPGLYLFDLLSTEFRKVNITIRKDEKIVVIALDFVDPTTQLFLQTKPEVVYNYLGFMKAFELLPLVSKRFQALYSELRQAAYGVEKDQPRWMRCIRSLQYIMKDTIGRLYMEKRLTKQAKQEVKTLVQEIGKTFYSRLRHIVWMDFETRDKARQKLSEMKKRVAYPETFLSDEYIDNEFSAVGTLQNSEHFVEIRDRFHRVAYEQLLSTLRASVRDSKDEWSVSATEDVNAYYSPETNEIVIPGGILQAPFFQDGLPSYINLAAIGSIVGHEISHGYDDEGSQYDSKGWLVNWWSNATEKEFNERKACFIHQYGSIVNPVTKTQIHGENTLGENIADNGGIRLAFATHVRLSEDDHGQVLPGLDEFTPEQLFFISHALVWCRTTRPEMGDEVMYDVHSPNRYRVNIPLRNMEEFEAAFQCKTGAPMHAPPKDRCILW
ncbi:neprilysin-1-like [Dermacentor andersoni]|uniref:neprilysin-1-like n=1 Tax=Dermacentor andersoni TaxID=34620 RepID=UPI00241596E5|nr:neprilysin-1-like [Dermacentor andersoni]